MGEKKKDNKSDNYDSGEWCIRQVEGKRAKGTADVNYRKFYAMFTSVPSSTLGEGFSKLGEGYKFSWYQSHTEAYQDRDFEDHTPVSMHNNIEKLVTTMWLLLNIQ